MKEVCAWPPGTGCKGNDGEQPRKTPLIRKSALCWGKTRWVNRKPRHDKVRCLSFIAVTSYSVTQRKPHFWDVSPLPHLLQPSHWTTATVNVEGSDLAFALCHRAPKIFPSLCSSVLHSRPFPRHSPAHSVRTSTAPPGPGCPVQQKEGRRGKGWAFLSGLCPCEQKGKSCIGNLSYWPETMTRPPITVKEADILTM